MNNSNFSRRAFLYRTVALAAGTPLALSDMSSRLMGAEPGPAVAALKRSSAKVAIVPCRSYGPEVQKAMARSFDLLGGIGSLVRNKTVTVKLNLTGTDFSPFMQKPVGETYMTHFSTALALASLLVAAGARRVRFVESTQSKAELAATLALADWDVKALQALGKLEFENTRNLGSGKSYTHLRVPSGGYMFSALELNHSYADTDVM